MVHRTSYIVLLFVLCLSACGKRAESAQSIADSLRLDSIQRAQADSLARLHQLPEGSLGGVFSVAPDRQVSFSQGNLQYQPSTGDFRFAQNQYDVLGKANSQISKTSTEYIDLFGWGTSGWQETGAKAFEPWSFSSKADDYAFNEEPLYPDDPTPGTCMTGNYAEADWGMHNAISNGGHKAGLWRTLTEREWLYIFYGRPHASSLFAHAEICGKRGFLLLPDNWKTPAGLSIVRSTDQCEKNQFDSLAWGKLEQAGAVFLPAAGYRIGKRVRDVNTAGYYNLATGDAILGTGYRGVFACTKADPYYDIAQAEGASVRLVRDLKIDSARIDSLSLAQVEARFPEGTLPGTFRIGKNKYVHFSQGNLQFQPASHRWRFALYQTDACAFNNSTQMLGNTQQYWIDLFKARTTERIQVANGGNTAGMWRELSQAEWGYLLHSRKNAVRLRSYARVDNSYGMILLPDNWTAPKDITFRPNRLNYKDNVYTYTQWNEMEQAGAVFLPETGYMGDADNVYTLANGYYWSSTPTKDETSSKNFYLAFTGEEVKLMKATWDPYDPAYDGRLYELAAYRLVREALN